MNELRDVFANMYENWGFGGDESRSGPGSSLEATEAIREKIKQTVKQFNIQTVVDIPCGDFNWMKEIVYSFKHYTGCDIVPELIRENQKFASQIISFVEYDLTGNDEIPEADLLIVRDVIGHLPLELGKIAIENILKSKCKYLLSTTWYNISSTDGENYYLTHENRDVNIGRFYPVCLRSAPFGFPAPELYIEESVIVDGHDQGNRKGLGFWNLDKVREFIRLHKESSNADVKIPPIKDQLPTKSNGTKGVTIVTGLWNLGRGDIPDSFKRSYEEYKERLSELMKAPINMFIYASKEDIPFILQHRSLENTFIRVMELEEMEKWFSFYNKVQEIRTNDEWKSQSAWLTESPQATLPMYNPMVMSKMFLLNDATLHNPFHSKSFYWIDAGITATVHAGYFYHDMVFNKLPILTHHTPGLTFLSYPYIGGNEIHGFPREKMAEYCNTSYVKYVCRGGFFGGTRESISQINSIYYHLLNETLERGLMGTEESLFTIIAHTHPELVYRHEIAENGLIWPFFEKLKDVKTLIAEMLSTAPKSKDTVKTILYVLGFNSPKQFDKLCKSIDDADKKFFKRSTKVLINNSTDEATFAEYDELCAVYGFEEIHKHENLGVCGGRQFAAEHFDETDADFYFFFEDDMLLNGPADAEGYCRVGFRRYAPALYDTLVSIMLDKGYDFIKMSFSEFYGENSTQWAWYNVPQAVRDRDWPEYNKLPETGLDQNSPKTNFGQIGSTNNIPYITGEIYYSNWPQIVSKSGNKKMFLNTTWARPYEQTWMSHHYQLMKEGQLKPAILLLSPVTHNRFDHYAGALRKES